MFPEENSPRTEFFELLDATMALNQKKGEKRTLSRIAKVAGINRKSIQAYFDPIPSKRRVPQPGKLSDLLNALKIFADGGSQAAEHIDRLQDAATRARLKGRNRTQAKKGTGSKTASPAIDIRAIAAFAPPTIVGREMEVALLQDAWQSALDKKTARPRVVVLHAAGGEGKTSLVAHWASDVAVSADPLNVFAWSFYNQGTSGQVMSTSDEFVNAALRHFGIESDATKVSTPMVRARLLVDLLQQTTTLLILDGLEPLQFSPGSSVYAALKDDVIRHLLLSLRRRNPGLCVVTTRLNISELNEGDSENAKQVVLPPLSVPHAIQFLRSVRFGFGDHAYRLRGTNDEFKELAEWTRGHALTLNLVGRMLLVAHQGALRMRDMVTISAADAKIPFASGRENHAWRVLEWHVSWLEQSSAKDGLSCLAILRALSLFDRPAPLDCLITLFAGTPIEGFTNPLCDATGVEIDITCKHLEALGLVTCHRASEFGMALVSIDTHPIIRDFFAETFRQRGSGAWSEAHRRLFEYFATQGEFPVPRDPSDLEPLYLAVVHGCKAGFPQRAFDEIFWKRICRGHSHYSTSKFGAVNRDLAALASFFSKVWTSPSELLAPDTQATIRSLSAFRLRSMGRFDEAEPLMRRALEYLEWRRDWVGAANEAGNLSVLLMHAGRLQEALQEADRSLKFAEAREHEVGESDSTQLFISGRYAVRADTLFQLGLEDGERARQAFQIAEGLQAKFLPARPLLYSTKGYRYHELLLDLGQAEEVLRRVEVISSWKTENYEILDQGLISLVQARAHLILGQSGKLKELQLAKVDIQNALDHFFLANYQESYVRALVIQVEIEGALNGGAVIIKDSLDRAWEMASRGPLALFQVDILLARVRTYLNDGPDPRMTPYPWESLDDDFKEAQRMITRMGYGRRRKEADVVRRLFNFKQISRSTES